MDVCHLLLRRPWQFDRYVSQDGRNNTYSFVFGAKHIILLPKKIYLFQPHVSLVNSAAVRIRNEGVRCRIYFNGNGQW